MYSRKGCVWEAGNRGLAGGDDRNTSYGHDPGNRPGLQVGNPRLEIGCEKKPNRRCC